MFHVKGILHVDRASCVSAFSGGGQNLRNANNVPIHRVLHAVRGKLRTYSYNAARPKHFVWHTLHRVPSPQPALLVSRHACSVINSMGACVVFADASCMALLADTVLRWEGTARAKQVDTAVVVINIIVLVGKLVGMANHISL